MTGREVWKTLMPYVITFITALTGLIASYTRPTPVPGTPPPIGSPAAPAAPTTTPSTASAPPSTATTGITTPITTAKPATGA